MTVTFEACYHRFILERFRQADTETVNVLNGSLHAWHRYYRFLQIIRSRYTEAAVPYVEELLRDLARRQEDAGQAGQSAGRPVTEQEYAEMMRMADTALQLHLDIESFFVFANILLDRIASTCRYYFWKRADWNHRELMDNLANICSRRPLRVPDQGLLRVPSELAAMIVSYRNTRIEHVEEPRFMCVTSWGPDKKPKILPTLLHPKEGETETIQKPSQDIDEIMLRLDAYMVSMLDFFDANADKSILPLARPAV